MIGRVTPKRITSSPTWQLLHHSCWAAMLPMRQALYIYIVLFSLLGVFSLSSFLEDKVFLNCNQLSLLLCYGQILPSNVTGNCRMAGCQGWKGP